MHPRRFVFFVGFAAVAVVASWSAASNSGGAPPNAAQDGCTCHAAMATSGVQVRLTVPANYTPGATYDIQVAGSGGPMPLPAIGQNQGGFALQVTKGTLAGGADVRAEGDFATHATEGNDQRSWTLQWTAPSSGAGTVTFFAAANMVNGDGVNGGGMDQWNKVAVEVPEAQVQTENDGSRSDSGSTPMPLWMCVSGLFVAAVVRLRRG